jgi:hypothetical protein
MAVELPADGRDFKDSRRGETAWVIASGRSVQYVPPSFFDDKLSVCVNFVGMQLNLKEFYTVSHYRQDALQVAAYRPDLPAIAPVKILSGDPSVEMPSTPNLYLFPTNEQQLSAFDVETMWPTDPDALVVGPTSLHMTMHFAAYLGAKHIVLVGADCGFLDGRSNFPGYAPGDNPMDVWAEQLPKVANKLRAMGVSVMSLNPFVNLALEGHPYHGPVIING